MNLTLLLSNDYRKRTITTNGGTTNHLHIFDRMPPSLGSWLTPIPNSPARSAFQMMNITPAVGDEVQGFCTKKEIACLQQMMQSNSLCRSSSLSSGHNPSDSSNCILNGICPLIEGGFVVWNHNQRCLLCGKMQFCKE